MYFIFEGERKREKESDRKYTCGECSSGLLEFPSDDNRVNINAVEPDAQAFHWFRSGNFPDR